MNTTLGPTIDRSIAAAPLLGRASIGRLGLRRARLELKSYFRNREVVIFNFLFGAMLMMLFGSVFNGEIEGTGVQWGQVLVAGVLAASLMSVSFANLAVSIAIERTDGTLKRLALSPVPKTSYFIGKMVMVLVCTLLVDALVLTIGAAMFGVRVPTDPAKLLLLTTVVVLGVASCSLLGIAYSTLARSAKGAEAVVTPPFIALQFVSGVWIPLQQLPPPLRLLGDLLPLRWIVQGMRAVFLPDSFLAQEPTGTWQIPTTIASLAAWTVGGFVLCLFSFRWKNRADG